MLCNVWAVCVDVQVKRLRRTYGGPNDRWCGEVALREEAPELSTGILSWLHDLRDRDSPGSGPAAPKTIGAAAAMGATDLAGLGLSEEVLRLAHSYQQAAVAAKVTARTGGGLAISWETALAMALHATLLENTAARVTAEATATAKTADADQATATLAAVMSSQGSVVVRNPPPNPLRALHGNSILSFWMFCIGISRRQGRQPAAIPAAATATAKPATARRSSAA